MLVVCAVSVFRSKRPEQRIRESCRFWPSWSASSCAWAEWCRRTTPIQIHPSSGLPINYLMVWYSWMTVLILNLILLNPGRFLKMHWPTLLPCAMTFISTSTRSSRHQTAPGVLRPPTSAIVLIGWKIPKWLLRAAGYWPMLLVMKQLTILFFNYQLH